MPHERLDSMLMSEVADLRSAGTDKGVEQVITDVVPPSGGKGRRYVLRGRDDGFLRMNSNSYLGLSHHPAVLAAEEEATRRFGVGPGGVRFVSGTFQPHVDLEARLASFHGRDSSIIFSSAYAAVVSALSALVTPETVVLSDELNHNCIINALRMTRPAVREIYPHLEYGALAEGLARAAGQGRRVIIVTDGVFSMRGDFADIASLADLARENDSKFDENVVLVVDDSHGVGAYGATGRGTEEATTGEADVLIGTLGKAFGVNGGYVVASEPIVHYLRERAPMYIYSNPITAGEAAAAMSAVDVLVSAEGVELLGHLQEMTSRFESGLVELGLETIPGPHPVVPLMVRDTDRTRQLVSALFEAGILATGLNFPVVPKGDQEIRFQVNADHTSGDIDYVLNVLSSASAG